MLVTYLVLTLLQHTQLSVLQPALCFAAKSYPGVNKHHLSNSAPALGHGNRTAHAAKLPTCATATSTGKLVNIISLDPSVQCMGHTLLSSALHTAI